MVVKLKHLYPWAKLSSSNVPWDRKFLNVEFLKSERKRLLETLNWKKNFDETINGTSVGGEVSYYVIPLNVINDWRVEASKLGDYVLYGLSALRNSIQIPLLTLIPRTFKQPQNYSLIRILKSKKQFLHNEKNNLATYAIIIEDYEPLEPDSIYVDVPFERKSVKNFLMENLVKDEHTVNSFQPILSSSPKIMLGKGGIALSSFERSSNFASELSSTFELILPPEYTTKPFPNSILKGKIEDFVEGIEFVLQENVLTGSNLFKGIVTENYENLKMELLKRVNHNGEFSLFAGIIPSNPSDIFKDVFGRFLSTEVNYPHHLDELKDNSDVDLIKTRDAINEDIWIQIAYQRRLAPNTDSLMSLKPRIVDSLIPDWLGAFETLGVKKSANHIARSFAARSFDNILKVAQSVARDDNKENVEEKHINIAWKGFINNFESFFNNREIIKAAKATIPEYYENKKLNALKAELTEARTLAELFENLKGVFSDIYELNEYLNKMILGGIIYHPEPDKFKFL